MSPSLVALLDGDELDRVLIHEWAHVQRRDDLGNVLQVAIRIVAGWHPALWWIDRRLHVEREIACDELTVGLTGSPKSYAACLMKLASVRAGDELTTAPAVFTRSGLRERILKIVSRRRPIAPFLCRSVAAMMISALGLISLAVGSVTLVEAAELSLPFLSSRMVIVSIARPVDMPVSTPAPRRTKPPAPAAFSQSSPRSTTPPALPLSEAAGHPTPLGVPELPAAPAIPAVERQPPPTPAPASSTLPAVTAPSQSPWTTAAPAGTAIGRKSKDAGIATGGFFTRAARRLAGAS